MKHVELMHMRMRLCGSMTLWEIGLGESQITESVISAPSIIKEGGRGGQVVTGVPALTGGGLGNRARPGRAD